jgi:PLP dependent protein
MNNPQVASTDPQAVVQSLELVRRRIAAACPPGSDPSAVTIVAVTKSFGPDAPQAALEAGLREFGENYYQEAADKYEHVQRSSGTRLHFIGRVQRNKARRIAGLFDVVQTVDDLKVARALDDAAASLGKRLDVLVQVNVALDMRQGVAPQELSAFGAALRSLPHLVLRGVMAMGPADRDAAGPAFAQARRYFEELARTSAAIDTLSMGMSDDLELAVAAGSTMVRIGSALFGARAPQEKPPAAIGIDQHADETPSPGPAG